MKESEERIKIMVENNRSGVFRINLNNELNYVNQDMAEILGYQVNEMIDRLIYDFMDEKGHKIFNDHMKKIKRTGDLFELHFINKDGTTINAITSTNPLFNSKNEYLGAVSIFVINDLEDVKLINDLKNYFKT